MRRQSVAFFLGDVSFLADSKFRALQRRLPDPDDFNSAVGAYWVALAAARRNGSPVIDVTNETASRFVPDLVAVGLVVEEGFPTGPFDAWKAMSPQQAQAGASRAAQAERDNAGRFRPAESSEPSALDRWSSAVQPSPPLPSIPINSETKMNARDDFDALDVYHELTMFRPWGQWSGDEIKVAMRDYGGAVVETAIRAEHAADAQRDTLWKRTKTRLAKDADRQHEERKAKPRPPKPDADVAYAEVRRIEAGILDGSISVEDLTT